MHAQITITESHDYRIGGLLFGRWWWRVYVPGIGMKSGFTRSRNRAQAKAEHAARKLASTPAQQTEEYTLPLNNDQPKEQ